MKILMRVALILLAFLIVANSPVLAKNKVQFIYIHGTNDNNLKKQQGFTADVQGLHPYIVNEFNKSETAKKYLLENGKYTISENPTVFYWGAESKEDLNLLADWLDVTKFFSPKLAQTVRSMSAHTLHDAIWIQKYNNMKPIIDKLHCHAKQITNDGDKVILLGHSAGSFITYEYILYKIPFINTQHFLKEQKIPAKTMKEIQKIGFKNTCTDALIDSGVAIYKRDNTFYVPPYNLVNNYKKLLIVEKTSCASTEYTAGIINFGSPVSLFYSGFAQDAEQVEASMLKAVLNGNNFFLNLNFAEDPLGYPIIKDDEYDKILSQYKNGNTSNLTQGFVYDKSNLRSNKSVISAHSAYWKKKKFFSKSIVKAYEEGINLFVNSNTK